MPRPIPASCLGSSGAGAMTHLTGELFKSLAGLPDIVHIPYRGGGPLISDLISGHIPMIAQSVTAHMMELHETGKVRMLCVTSPKRLVAFPTLPTAIEAGLPNMVAQNFIGLFAPAKTPKEIIDQLAQATRAAMADEQFKQAFVSSGFDPYPEFNAGGDAAICRGGARALDTDHQVDRFEARLNTSPLLR